MLLKKHFATIFKTKEMKRQKFLTFVLLFAVALCAGAAKTPKYVFYFIGDGMGLNQVN